MAKTMEYSSNLPDVPPKIVCNFGDDAVFLRVKPIALPRSSFGNRPKRFSAVALPKTDVTALAFVVVASAAPTGAFGSQFLKLSSFMSFAEIAIHTHSPVELKLIGLTNITVPD